MTSSAKSSWKDTTSYGRDERGTAQPREFTLTSDGLRIVVHHIWDMPEWYVSINGTISSAPLRLEGDTGEKAKREAKTRVKALLRNLAKGIP